MSTTPSSSSEPSSAQRSAVILGLAGLLPFFASALAGLVLSGELRSLALASLLGYGAVIVSFLGGARWGAAWREVEPNTLTLLAAVSPSIVGWAGLLLALSAPSLSVVSLALLIASFAFMLMWDLQPTAPWVAWYRRLRILLTSGAIAALLVGAFATI